MKHIFTLTLMLSSLALAQPVFADSGHDHGSHKQQQETAQMTPAQAWDSLQHGLAEAKELSNEGNLDGLHDVTDSMSKAIKALQDEHPDNARLQSTLSQTNSVVTELHVAGDKGDTRSVEKALKKLNGALMLVKSTLPEDLQKTYDHDEHSEHSHDMGDEAHAHGAPTINIEIVKTPELIQGQKNDITIKLTHKDDGRAVILDDLQVAHTKPVHLLIVEPQLTDYHHEHPVKTDVAGEYIFSMTPQTSCTYRIWADLLPVNGSQQYVPIDLKGDENCEQPINKTVNYEASSQGYDFKLDLEDDLKSGEAVFANLSITKDGQNVDFLEPVMGAFAHMVGFYEDYSSIAHIHPLGKEPSEASERGGPMLRFHIEPEQAGYLKLFAQVQIDNKQVFAAFGMMVNAATIDDNGEHSEHQD